MNKKQLRELPWRSYGKVRCSGCGAMKWACATVTPTMIIHITRTSHCCSSPFYSWTDIWRHDYE